MMLMIGAAANSRQRSGSPGADPAERDQMRDPELQPYQGIGIPAGDGAHNPVSRIDHPQEV
jgi:hypothetical protein